MSLPQIPSHPEGGIETPARPPGAPILRSPFAVRSQGSNIFRAAAGRDGRTPELALARRSRILGPARAQAARESHAARASGHPRSAFGNWQCRTLDKRSHEFQRARLLPKYRVASPASISAHTRSFSDLLHPFLLGPLPAAAVYISTQQGAPAAALLPATSPTSNYHAVSVLHTVPPRGPPLSSPWFHLCTMSRPPCLRNDIQSRTDGTGAHMPNPAQHTLGKSHSSAHSFATRRVSSLTGLATKVRPTPPSVRTAHHTIFNIDRLDSRSTMSNFAAFMGTERGDWVRWLTVRSPSRPHPDRSSPCAPSPDLSGPTPQRHITSRSTLREFAAMIASTTVATSRMLTFRRLEEHSSCR